jgi:hypothetical protein
MIIDFDLKAAQKYAKTLFDASLLLADITHNVWRLGAGLFCSFYTPLNTENSNSQPHFERMTKSKKDLRQGAVMSCQVLMHSYSFFGKSMLRFTLSRTELVNSVHLP